MTAAICMSVKTAARHGEAEQTMLSFLILTTAFLCVLSVEDIHTRTIPGWSAPACGTAMGILHLFLRDMTLTQLLAGLIPGAVLLFLSFLLHTSLGTGDGLVVLVCGAAVGLEKEFAALTAALVFCAGFCIPLLLLQRVRRRGCLPFLPFLAASHLVMLTAEVIV